MDIRLNKLISDAGICSRREADSFIKEGRVTVNGKQPHVGEKVTVSDVVLIDGERFYPETYIRRQEQENKEEAELRSAVQKAKPSHTGAAQSGGKKPGEKFGKFNKYAAARHAAKEGGWKPKPKETDEEKLLREALRPKFGKSLSRSAVAQRIAANPKSAALRKTSKNNPINKAKRTSTRKNREQGENE